jgi:hypothetical protein
VKLQLLKVKFGFEDEYQDPFLKASLQMEEKRVTSQSQIAQNSLLLTGYQECIPSILLSGFLEAI